MSARVEQIDHRPGSNAEWREALVIRPQGANQTIGKGGRRCGCKPLSPGVDRRIDRSALAVADHRRLAAVRHGLTKNKQGRGDNDQVRAHGSRNPHELHAPVGRVVLVARQRFRHAFTHHY
jgi:hypothetical protein